MSTATFELDATTSSTEETLQYRALHTGAIVGLVLGLLSGFMLLAAATSLESSLKVAPIPIIGIIVSYISLSKIRRDSEYYTGAPIALAGLVLSSAFLVTGVGYGGYVYSTEVPDGYARISFSSMKPTELQQRSGTLVPPEIAALDGKKVFIKGYIRPDSITLSRGIKEFLLVRDNNQCCFGDLSKMNYFDQMQVDMVGSRTVDYSQGIFRIGGILRVEPRNLAPGSPATVFSLRADYAK
jgi:hypothetical protein